ncbi:FlgO family outer membrane protein [Neorhizobium sp. LjRoot104]|uniref:FlgO family outer membrane protein n=1 Tax=Neorhizobium sp. LjRoot104 TaxID=3342254 RepID=UPI003ECCC8C8
MRKLLLGVLLSVPVIFAGSGRSTAAESVDDAVDQIAQQFVASRAGAATTSRVAVTAFVQSDQKTTQFTNLVMIALTGKLVQRGGNVFRVIERAQLENALQEIQLSEVDLFNPDSAKKFGSFLGVDQLVVGEITPLFDRVRVDSRLIDVETIETIQNASVWIPLTPPVQQQLEKQVSMRRLSINGDSGPDPRNGIWSGTGQCGENVFGVAVSMVVNTDHSITALQTYYPTANGSRIEAGVLSMEGSFDPATNNFTLAPLDWLYRPNGHTPLGFTGKFDTGRKEIQASYTQQGCGKIRLRKQ